MRHEIRPEELGPLGQPMVAAIEACVHCGFCLPACPTYQVLEQETDSPRGRIVLMKEVLEGTLELGLATEHLDACLGCLACVTACPSGVEYGDLITSFRMTTEQDRKRPLVRTAARQLALSVIPEPSRLRQAARLGSVGKLFARFLPAEFQAMLGLLPEKLPAAEPLEEHYPAVGEVRGHVALLAGCAQQVLMPAINLATIHVLTHNGVEVSVPRNQGCCGALAAHAGHGEQARKQARRNLAAFPAGVDAVVTNAAGCGSGMRDYGLWLRGTPDEQAADELAGRTVDVSVYLARLGLRQPDNLPEGKLRVAWHDACHLAHGQGVMAEPRQIISSIDGAQLVEAADSISCCGSAGTYNIEQPEIAGRLGELKARSIERTDPDVILSSNIGCLTQLQAHSAGRAPLLHLMQFLAAAYGPAGPGWSTDVAAG